MFARFLCFALLSLATVASGQNREVLGEYRIGLVGAKHDPIVFQVAKKGAQQAAIDLSRQRSIDVELLIKSPNDSNRTDQAGLISELFAEQADAILISPEPKPSVREALRFANSQGQKVAFFQRELPGFDPVFGLSGDEYKAGQLAGQEMLKRLRPKQRIAILTSSTESEELRQRMQGLRDTIGYQRIQTVVTTEPNYHSAMAAIQRTVDEDYDDLVSGWVFLEDWPLRGKPALPWKPKRTPAVAIQSSPSAFLYLDQKYIHSLIVHPYYEWGYQSLERIIGVLHSNQLPAEPSLQLEPTVIDWKNVASYREQWKAWLQ